MTIVQVVPELETGGAERTAVDIAGALVEAGARAIVVSQGGRLVDELIALGGEHVTMPVGTKSPVGLYRNARHLAALMERQKADIIHARSRAPAWSALWAASWTGRPFLTTYHGAYNERTIVKNRYNSVMVRGRKVIANSQYTADLIRRRHPFAADRIVTIHRGTDLARFADPGAAARGAAMRAGWGIAADVPILLNIARLTPWKGQMVLVEALALLAAEHPAPFVCVLAGEDQGRSDYSAALTARAAELGVADRLHLAGHVADVAGALAAATVAVQPSTEPEAFGRAAVEAEAAGVPVVVSDLGAVRETVLAPPEVPAEARTGWRVPPGEAAALAAALADALAASPEARAAIGARGKAHAHAYFSLEAMKKKTLAVYHSLLEDERSALY
ncbi:MAG: glycosyltransferase family 4 protein [Acuticoccus sp.]